MAKAVFHDPQRKRWKRLRILFDVVAALLLVFFVVSILSLLHSQPLPKLLLADQKRPYRALKEKERKHPPSAPAPTAGSKTPPSQVVLNSEEGIRGAFYVTWDAASFSALNATYRRSTCCFRSGCTCLRRRPSAGVSRRNTFLT